MKNNLKKIIPLILCFVILLGTCINVNAKTVSGVPLVEDFTYTFGFDYIDSSLVGVRDYANNSFSSQVKIKNKLDVVYAVFAKYKVGSVSGLKLYFISLQPFSLEIASASSSGNVLDGASSYKNHSSYSDFILQNSTPRSYDGIGFYTCETGVGSSVDYVVTDTNIPVRDLGVAESYNQFLSIFVKDDFTWDDGLALEYAQSPTATIEPPQNLSIYRGYSNADKQYKFQMQWDKPADTDLNVEVMYNIHWKEGTGSALGFGTHVYKKYQHLVYDDGHSAQTNKLQYLEDDLLKGYFESQEMDVPSVYNIDEIYVRFAKEVDGVIQYSLWRKIDYLNLDEGNGFDSTEDDFQAESSTGAFDTSDNWIDQSVQNGEIVNGSDKEDAKAPGLDANGDNITNVTKPIVNPDSWDSEFSNVFDSFTNAIKSAFSFVGEFPSMLSEFFGFLPASVIGCISIGLIMVVVLRFLGR